MLDDLVQQLRSPDAKQRREAITALANTKNQAALSALAQIYRTDPDPAVRELALKAGRYIRQHADNVPAASSIGDVPAGSPLATATGPQALSVSSGPAKITERDKEIARGYLDTATTHMTQGDKVRAVENLGKALSLNPELAKESFVYNLILTLTGLPPADALPLLTHPDRRGELIVKMGGKSKLKKVQAHGKGAENATWDNVLQDFGIYWLVVTVSLLIIFISIIPSIQDALNSMPMPASSTSTVDFDTLSKVSLVGMMMLSVIVGITSLVSLALQIAAIHAAATYILGGDGTLVYLYRRLVPFQSLVTLAGAAAFVVLVLFSSNVPEIACIVPMGMIVGSVAVSYYMAQLVGEVYNFGMGSGCGAIVIGGVLLAGVSWFGNYLLLSVLGKLLGG